MLELSVNHILDVALQELLGISSIQLFQRFEFILCFIVCSLLLRGQFLVDSIEQASAF